MNKKLNSILLIDDNPADNLYHKMIIEGEEVTDSVKIAEDGVEAIDYLKSTFDGKYPQPDLVFLDINMPRMNGWEFLEEYSRLNASQKGRSLLMMLSTSNTIEDKRKSEQYDFILGYGSKPLTVTMLWEIIKESFPDHI
ncbi:response regulator [uncultured Roseivirga sp.]|uniref:response regulator n=1 Tax=uncultured Roseivirga sp. TaxID=543088 RepID=UPI0030DB8374